MASPSSKKQSSLKKHLLTLGLLVGCGAALYGLIVRVSMVAPPANLPAALCVFNCKSEKPFHSTAIGIETGDPLEEQRSVKDLIGPEFNAEKVSVLVEKSAYKLTVFYDSEPVKTYSSVFGSAPVGDKFAEGDRKTPEGIYHVRDLYPHPEWSKFIWLDYPTPQDWQEHTAAKLAGDIAETATIGSEVGIHGVPNGSDALIDSRTNWTWGCISLKNKDVSEIYEVLSQGTLVEIVP